MKTALITGITGQDGSFLAEFLLDRGYKVFGLARRESWMRANNASHLADRITVLFGDMSEGIDIATALQEAKPDEIYNLASQSRPGESWARAPETLMINGMGAIRLFEAVRHAFPKARVYHASSSEMFGGAKTIPQSEETPFHPANPYAAAKVYAHHMVRICRESYGLFISSGILFNHESERRPLHFVTQKIAYGAACAALGITNSLDLNERGQPIVSGGRLALGNLDIARDWGHAIDFVRAMWLMLQHEKPDDFVVGTGKLHTLRDLCRAAYGRVGLNWEDHVVSDPGLVRPLETGQTLADPSKARKILGWEPTISFEEMVGKMVDTQIERLEPQIRR
ncbi:GDP-mannose 4,6-dehydratase [Paraburkholderia saeva]|uniref:GDP-mannose 4,6-dehydratase n=1 Tax=Paraburkholderia saeva TaxID=2777537 RepID=A0A9N8RT46_9BURK|nr:GDP-mannose 4,6-dehydratase [Paraburkholderia saeva]CAG4887816.1 GDP-mannose 4,6-dehydratase [Paraburkholderia saeva]CAG4901849.1 GDP-mannose 4,6-dehydratase [Paraburkholderia saeva]